MSNSSTKISLEDYINSFLWNNRIVLLITKEYNFQFIRQSDNFFKRNKCENEARNLKYIRIVGDDINKYVIPDRYKHKYGIWLIGYDGREKSYSNDSSLLKSIYSIIDTMPIRKMEMVRQNKKCT
tara:strand:- start:13 stop:387 length:375 start_codon:yes stop_codon:yes gene_type:complete